MEIEAISRLWPSKMKLEAAVSILGQVFFVGLGPLLFLFVLCPLIILKSETFVKKKIFIFIVDLTLEILECHSDLRMAGKTG
jgi:hypothetical protein